jgi:hypothetical protein
MLRIADILGASDIDYASAVNLMQVCKDLHKAFLHKKAAPATIQLIRALFRDVATIRCQSVVEPTALRCTKNGALHSVVSIEGVDRLRVCYMNPSRPYVNELSAISTEDGHFKGKMMYVNLTRWNFLNLDFDVTAPWHIHGLPRNAEDAVQRT